MIKTEYAVLTNAGGREINEDTVLAVPASVGLAVTVADGLGGHGGGSTASRAAAEAVSDSFARGFCRTKEEIEAAVCLADQAVVDCQTEACAMKTTLVSLFVEGEQAVWAHVGDSRLYHFRDGKLEARTLDHSVPQLAVMMGMITEEQIRFHEDRNRVLRALGSDSFTPDISEPVSLAEGFHAFLLCTDGFWEYVLEQEMEQTLADSPDPRQWLLKMETIMRGRAPADQDNYTAAAVFAIGEK
ncbi:MAG: serine/threonine-protein phosphatase [Enterocloster asparagiformis]|nr:serine/threonine-protein phosphatase [Enterocloster asparagiformis]